MGQAKINGKKSRGKKMGYMVCTIENISNCSDDRSLVFYGGPYDTQTEAEKAIEECRDKALYPFVIVSAINVITK